MVDVESNLSPDQAAHLCAQIEQRILSAAIVNREVRIALLATVLSRGHALIEDVPGTGKSVTARVLAQALGLSFTRIQFTPDLLPSDVTGSNIYNEDDRSFDFSKGPVFTNVALADEINRAPPKTQAALLEAMEERQVSADGTTHDLPTPFLVVATQNPIEQAGTFPLPEAQRDRFSVKISLGYPDIDGEMELLDQRASRRTLSPSVKPVVNRKVVLALQALTEKVHVNEKIRRYIIDLARETRTDERTEVGVSPRGVQRVFEIARAAALIDGRGYVVPDDVKQLAEQTMAHRLVLTTEATVEGVDPVDVIRSAVESVAVPAVAPGTGGGRDAEQEPEPATDVGTAQQSGPARQREPEPEPNPEQDVPNRTGESRSANEASIFDDQAEVEQSSEGSSRRPE